MQNKRILSESKQSKQKWNKIKIGIFSAMSSFPDHALKLKAPDQPQSTGEESILARDIT